MNSLFGHGVLGDNSLSDIGKELVGHAQQSVPVKRGIVDELFPYILIASKTMSARAISRWLEEKKNISLSATSVAKAIREKDRFLDRIYKRALPGAEYLASRTDFSADEILVNLNRERESINKEYEEKLNGTDEERARSADLIIGLKMLIDWGCVPEEVRNMCIELCIKNKKEEEK